MVNTALATEPRLDPRVARTQKLIRDALKTLLAEKNFESISVQDIAERATVNRATFYAHFTDKFALLNAIIREHVATVLADGDPLGQTETRALLRAVGKNVFAFVGMHRTCRIDRDFEPQLESAIEAELTEFLQPTFEHCTASLVASALVGSAMNWRHQAPKMDFAPAIAKIVDVLVDGVARGRHPI
ncbi:MAG TPA: TetR/AcrR family transcriptional regulator [Candidatus Baltobacteraceae bacterium]|jgi:AcrR family transcriptional regulator|nr:TetR/AcrR family transcriptional regulator [Candidatus Baltobacteraceae bacterium]